MSSERAAARDLADKILSGAVPSNAVLPGRQGKVPARAESSEAPSKEAQALQAELVPPLSDIPEGLGLGEVGWQRLGYLRPRDTFLFEKEVPYIGVDLRTEYRIVPAPRGYIRFTDDYKSVYQVPIDYAIKVRVKLTSEEGPDHNYPFYAGDRVKAKETGAMGEVLRARAQGYEVRFDGVEENESQWMPSGSIRLVDKDLTTRNYIRNTADHSFVVSYADTYETFPSAVQAVHFLKESNRPAFNRLSKLVASEGVMDFPWIDRPVLEYFVEHDQRVWKKGTVDQLFSEVFPDGDA